jgi:signal transduction histidine kinase
MARARDPNRLATYLHSKAEDDKAHISQELHDELGGLMVAALMDAVVAEEQLPSLAKESHEKLLRVKQSLGSAIDLERKIVESIRPTLLDNIGLFAALSWLLKNYGLETGLRYSKHFPSKEPRVEADVSIALFRFVQEALHHIVSRKGATSVALSIDVTDTTLTLSLAHDGISREVGESPEFASLKHRILTLGGEFSEIASATYGTTIRAIVNLN